jgi:hypothetical protein
LAAATASSALRAAVPGGRNSELAENFFRLVFVEVHRWSVKKRAVFSGISARSPLSARLAARVAADAARSRSAAPTDLAWRVIGLVNLYRLLIPPSVYAIYAIRARIAPVGSARPELFLWTCIVYFATAWPSSWRAAPAAQSACNHLRARHGRRGRISLLMFSSGGVASGLGILFVVPVGAMALLADSRDAFVLAALAALALLAQQIGGHRHRLAPRLGLHRHGILGGIVFLVALLAWPVARRLRDTEATVRRQQVDLANSRSCRSTSCSTCARASWWSTTRTASGSSTSPPPCCSATAAPIPGALLGEASPQLLYLLETWRQRTATPATPSHTFVADDGGHVIQPHFASLGGSEPSPVIVFLEDTELLAAKIQQSKLAGLGRLSASIAHEIRNPVGAMSHAAQLLASPPRSRTRTSASRRSSAPTATACGRSSRTSCPWRGARTRAPSAWCWRRGSTASATSSAPPCRSRRRAGDLLAAGRRRSAGGSLAAAADRLEPVRERREVRRHATPATTPSSCGRTLASTRGPFLEVADRGPASPRSIANASSSRSSPATSAARAWACSWRASWRRPTAPLFL